MKGGGGITEGRWNVGGGRMLKGEKEKVREQE